MPTEINLFLLCSGTNFIIMNNNNPDMAHTVETQRSPEEIILAFLVLQMKHARVMAEMMRVLRRIEKARKKPRTEWTKNFLRKRTLHAQYESLMHELKWENPADFRNCMRFGPEMFDELLQRLTPRIKNNISKVLEANSVQ